MVDVDLIGEFKDRLHISHSSEDMNIDRLLTMSYAYIKRRCGEFSLDTNLVGQELVLERAKCAYEGQLAYFDENYEMMIVAFGLDLQSVGDVDETTV